MSFLTKIKIASLLLCLLFSFKGLATPVRPRTLRELILESEYIIRGYVVDIYKVNTPASKVSPSRSFGGTIAKIEVQKVLKGNLAKDTIEVPFDPDIMCPRPPEYKKGTTILAFLDKYDNQYITHLQSYGLKILKKSELDLYERRILEMQQILKISNRSQQEIQTIEWLVTCVENKVTRWEATFDLLPKNDLMLSYSKYRGKVLTNRLQKSQKERLAKVFFASVGATVEYDEFDLLDLIHKEHQETIDKLLMKSLATLPDDELWTVTYFTERLKHRSTDKSIKTLEEQMGEIMYDNKKTAALRKLIQKFLKIVA